MISEPRYSILLRIWERNQLNVNLRIVQAGRNIQTALLFHTTAHLCCHDKAGGSGVDGDVPGHQPHILEFLIHLPVFLVGEGFDGTGENHSLFLSECQCNGIPVRRRQASRPRQFNGVLERRNTRSTDTHSAHTVLPAEVCADTRTDSLLSIHKMASRWKGSRINGYSCKSNRTG